MFRVQHHVSSQLNRILNRPNPSHSTESPIPSVHNSSVELDLTVTGQTGAKTSIEDPRVFHGHCGGYDGVEGGLPSFETSNPRLSSTTKSRSVPGGPRLGHLIHGPGAAVK